MLTHLYIENFLLVEKLDIDFFSGLTIITGETGAGKSIILDALSLILGARAESQWVRVGAPICTVIATFSLFHHPQAREWLTTQGFSLDDGACIIRRQISAEGRSRCFIQQQPVPLQSLRELGELLVNMHGQHENQRLLHRHRQQELLDTVAGHEELIKNVAAHYHAWQAANTQWQQCTQQLTAREQRLSFLRYQLQDFAGLILSAENIAELENTHRQLATAEQRLQQYHHVVGLLENDNAGILNQLKQALQFLPSTEKNIRQLLETAQIQLHEAANELQQTLTHTEINPEKLAQTEIQLSQLHELARKHKIKMQQLPEVWQQLQQEYQQLETLDGDIAQLEKQQQLLAQQYQKTAAQLRQSREKAAKMLQKNLRPYLTQLGMEGAKLVIDIQPYEENKFTAHGTERIEFLVSINPGQPLQPLAKTASGGELSRLSLAIQAISTKNQILPTLIFDEVDVGIGGSTATIVGQLLQQLAKQAQILCITHLPQVAAYGQQHLYVQKHVHHQHTITQLNYLTPEDRIEEIARMLGGKILTPQSKAHAQALLESQ